MTIVVSFKEFKSRSVVNYTGTSVQDFLDFANKLDEDALIQSALLHEDSTKEKLLFIEFVSRNTTQPKVGSYYLYASVTYIPKLNYLSTSMFKSKKLLVATANNKLTFDFNGNHRQFPEHDDLGDGYRSGACFKSLSKFKEFMVMAVMTFNIKSNVNEVSYIK
jgi:hypothetical protein